MGNNIGRLSRNYNNDVVEHRTRLNEVVVSDTTHENDTSSELAPFQEQFSDIGSDVDKTTIKIVDYQVIQDLLREITEKQFEKAYQQAVILLSSGTL